MVALVIAMVAGVVAAVSGAANPVSAVQFVLSGHWVYNVELQSAFHVDGSTGDVDARARIAGGPGDQVFQGDTSGYVVGRSRITEFGKSSLSVADTSTPPSRELPVGVETAGGPYLVYREDGKIVRLGDPPAVLSLGGPVGTPVATRDGTLWLPRTSAGLLCQMAAGAKHVSCSMLLPKGHAGALSVVGNRVVFVDAETDLLHVVERDGLGAGRALGVDVGASARLASTDVGGRVVILDGARIHLVDLGLDGARQDPVTVDLDEGEYSGPVSTGSVVAVVNRNTRMLMTFDDRGERQLAKQLPAEKGDPRLTRGEDARIYVDGSEGLHVVVVDKDGELTDVPIEDEGGEKNKTTPQDGADTDERADSTKPDKPESPNKPDKPDKTDKPDQDQRRDSERDNRNDRPAPPPPPPPPPAPNPPQPDPPPVETPPSVPGAPTAVRATAGNSTATVRWQAAPDNRSPITGYQIVWPGGQTTAAAGDRQATISGLANGTSYVFTVRAVNAVGTGPGAASNAVTPVAPVRPASAPTNLSVEFDTANQRAVVSWNPPADLGGGTLVHYILGVTDRSDAAVPGQTATVEGIPETGSMTFTVRAVTEAGGQQLVGETASTAQEVPTDPGTDVPEVVLTRGASTSQWCGESPDCAWMHIEVWCLQPNTVYTLMPDSSNPNYGNPGGELRTDANGYGVTEQFAYTGVGHTVWVTATSTADGSTVRSNDLVWEAG